MNNPWHGSKPIGPKPKDIYRDVHLSLKVLRRCRKPPPWVHYHKDGRNVNRAGCFSGPLADGGVVLRTDSPFSTACGKTSKYRLFCGPAIVAQLSAVTCPLCIEVLKKTHWHCPVHGFVDDREVTFEESCEMCGNPVV